MLWFILAGAITLGAFLYFGLFDNYVDMPDTLGITFGFAMATGLIALVINGCVMLAMKPHYPDKAQEVHTIVAMNDGQSSSGSFFLGSGYYNGYDVFRYYTKNENGGMNLNSSMASTGTVYEMETTQPRVEYYFPEDNNKWLTLWTDKNSGRLEVFVVPPGSVKQNFTLDAQ